MFDENKALHQLEFLTTVIYGQLLKMTPTTFWISFCLLLFEKYNEDFQLTQANKICSTRNFSGKLKRNSQTLLCSKMFC